MRVSDVGRIEDLLLEIVKARAGECPDGRVWEVLGRVLRKYFCWAEREREAIFDGARDLH